jgi:hypothetical protein
MTDPDERVRIVIAALEHLHASGPDEAKRLLDMYAKRDELTLDQQRQVIDHFRPRRA